MIKRFPFELFIWSGALIILAFSYPGAKHFTLCPMGNFGIPWCPGCGLGRSLSYLLHGEIRLSWDQHWFGMPALIILIHRIMQLLNKFLLNLMKPNRIYHGQRSAY